MSNAEPDLVEVLPLGDDAAGGGSEAPIEEQARQALALDAATALSNCTGRAVALALLNPRLRMLWANEPFERLFGSLDAYRGEYLTKFFASSFNDERRSEVYGAVHSATRDYSWHGVVARKDSSGIEVVLALAILPVQHAGAGGDPPAYHCLMHDISDHHRKTLRDTFMSLLEASRLKDNDTGKHVQRVGAYSRILAERLLGKADYPQVDAQYLQDISYLAAMHDVGKIGTSDNILNKGGPLTDAEREQMKEHTINGAYLLSTYPSPMAKEIALFHHEWWDGRGYPYGLTATMIPLSARIVAIADVYDALRMKRSYKAAIPEQEAVRMIGLESGTHFDPALFAEFQTLRAEFAAAHQALAD